VIINVIGDPNMESSKHATVHNGTVVCRRAPVNCHLLGFGNLRTAKWQTGECERTCEVRTRPVIGHDIMCV